MYTMPIIYVMKTKLTLSIDEELVQYARHQARQDGQSVSDMFSSLLLARKSQTERKAVPPVAAMVGTLKRYSIDDSKSAVRTAYAERF